jgi:hypothetical protein
MGFNSLQHNSHKTVCVVIIMAFMVYNSGVFKIGLRKDKCMWPNRFVDRYLKLPDEIEKQVIKVY